MDGNLDNKIMGGLFGALVGDACGCPYEFRPPHKIPSFDKIDMVPPEGYDRAWKEVPVGTYTDDGAQVLILSSVLFSGSELLQSLRIKLLAWYHGGYMSVDNITFDVGGQTRRALVMCDSIDQVAERLSEERFGGNGSLMRCIPASLYSSTLEQAVRIGGQQSYATHPNNICVATCALYAGIGHLMIYQPLLNEKEIIDWSATMVRKVYPNLVDALDYILKWETTNEISGSGYVVDSFWSALWALRTGTTYSEVIKHAISLGNDTDTTACIAGGLAGIAYGFSGIPSEWISLLRGREIITPIVLYYRAVLQI